jgi:hypothetical protein
MNVLGTPLAEWGTSWGNFENWLNSRDGWMFYAAVFLAIVVTLFFVQWVRGRRRGWVTPGDKRDPHHKLSAGEPEIADAGGGWQWVRIGAYSFKRKVPAVQPQEATSPPPEEAQKDEVPP